MMNAPADEYFTFQVILVLYIVINIVEKHAKAFHKLIEYMKNFSFLCDSRDLVLHGLY